MPVLVTISMVIRHYNTRLKTRNSKTSEMSTFPPKIIITAKKKKKKEGTQNSHLLVKCHLFFKIFFPLTRASCLSYQDVRSTYVTWDGWKARYPSLPPIFLGIPFPKQNKNALVDCCGDRSSKHSEGISGSNRGSEKDTEMPLFSF